MIATSHRLPSGFQQTEVGVIPDDWEVDSIINRCEYADYRGKTPPKTQSGTFLITARNVRKGYIDYEESQEFIPTELYDQIMARGKPRIGDVLITTEAPLGNVAQVDREDVALAQRIIKYRPRTSDLSLDYLKHFLLSDAFQRLLTGRGSGTTATGIKGSVLHQLPIAIPPLAEQEAIAEALGDADALIESLEQLVAKKRHLKQAAMQQLLTGKKRLTGFVGEWKEKALGEMFDISAGGDLNKACFSPFRTAKYCHPIFANSITNAGLYGFTSEYRYEAEAISVTARGTLGVANYRPMNFDAIGRLLVLRPRVHTDCFFVAEFINNEVNFAIESTGVPQLTAPQISNHSVSCPEYEEQHAIATVLSDMDAEIEAIEAKLAKARQIKQGMMQELLTGRIRLAAPESSTEGKP